MKRACIDCGAMYEPRTARQKRCESCRPAHDAEMNAECQRRHRACHRTPEEAERSLRRTWRMDAALSRIEMLVAEGLSPSAAAAKAGISHQAALRHVAKREVQARIMFLRYWDRPEPELPC
jgi:hypothetical protein